jgi:uncharacterized membrane protein
MSPNPDHALGLTPVFILVLGTITSLIGLPLIARRVPRNLFHGIRTPLAFSSDENWYRVNAIGGRFFLRAGLATMLIGAAGFFLPRPWLTAYPLPALLLALLFTATAAIACLRIR